MDGRPHVAVIFPRWHSEFCQIPLRIPVTNKRCAGSFCGHDCARRPASFVLALFKSRENAPSTAAPAAGRITCLDLSSRATVGAAEVDPESQSTYCLSIAKLHMVSLALDCYSKVSSPPTPLVCAPAVRPPLGHHAQASASTTLVLHARNGVVHTLSVEP